MDETRKPEGNRWSVVIWIIVFLAVIALGLIVSQNVNFTPAAPAEPVLTAEFADGGTLEIIGVSVRERVVEIQPSKLFSISLLSTKGSSGGSYGGLNFNTEEEGGKVVRTTLTSTSPAAMFIEFRMINAHGAGMTYPFYLAKESVVFEDSRLSKTRVSREFSVPQESDLESLRAAMVAAGLQVLFQQHDPDAGWINLMGPSLFYEPWPDRYIVTLNAWRRDLPTLDFRTIREDGEVVEFSLPNPDFRKASAKTAPAVTLPHIHKESDFSLTVDGVRRISSPGNLPFTGVDLRLQYLGEPVAGLKDGPIDIIWGAGDAVDEWGNEVRLERNSIRKKSLLGARVPLNSRRLSLDLMVRRTLEYPHSDHSGYMLLEGKVTDDGLGVDFQPGPDAALLGVSTMPVGRITKNAPRNRRSPTSGWSELEFKVKGEGNQLEAINRRIGNILEGEFHVFIGDRDESSGMADGGQGGSGGYGGGSFHFDRRCKRSFPPEDLAPGTKVRVSMDAPMKIETIHLELELPATVENE